MHPKLLALVLQRLRMLTFIDANAFRAESEIRFFPRLSTATSDFRSSTEPDEVLRFVCRERAWLDIENFADVIAKPLFQLCNSFLDWVQFTRSACVNENCSCDRFAATSAYKVSQIAECAAERSHVVHQYVIGFPDDFSMKGWAGV